MHFYCFFITHKQILPVISDCLLFFIFIISCFTFLADNKCIYDIAHIAQSSWFFLTDNSLQILSLRCYQIILCIVFQCLYQPVLAKCFTIQCIVLFHISTDSAVVLLLIHLLQLFEYCLLSVIRSNRMNTHGHIYTGTDQKSRHNHSNQNLRHHRHPCFRHPLGLLLPLLLLSF